MPTTRPGYIWSGTEWVAIGQEAIASPFYYQATAPSTPSTGDIWVESDVDVPSIDSSLFYRWKKTAVGGETSLSGADDNGLSLQYTPNYEQVFINGVLMVRGSDYTATTGTTITGLTALVAGDIVTVMSQVAYALADVYTQSQSDAKYSPKIATGMSLVVPTSVSVNAGSASVSANGAITLGSGISTVTVNGAFSSMYDNYKIIASSGSASTDIDLSFQLNGSTSGYYRSFIYSNWVTNSALADVAANTDRIRYIGAGSGNTLNASFDVLNPYLAKYTSVLSAGMTYGTYAGVVNGIHAAATSYSGFIISAAGGTISSGTIRIYGYNNGA